MNELTLKCTRYTIVENDNAVFYVKEVDGNAKPVVIVGKDFDSVTIIDKDVKKTRFYLVKIKTAEPPVTDGDWRVTPVVATYSHKEEIF